MNPRVAIVGGGPGGLLFAGLLRRLVPSAAVTLYERNQPADAFGFGVVFSDLTLQAIDEVDPTLRRVLDEHGRHWNRIEVWSSGHRHGFDGNGMSAVHRKALLSALQTAAADAGVDLRFGQQAPAVERLIAEFDLVVGADGTNSAVREHLGNLGHEVEQARAKFIWFGTTHMFQGLTFVHRVSEHGNFAAHAYPISDELSTFIVETDEATWRAAGLDAFDVTQPPGPSDTDSQTYLTRLFAEDLAGGQLVTNNSRWGNFRTRRTDHWYRGNVALLGDAVHTAHFSVGSGTKMAMEDSIALAQEIAAAASAGGEISDAFARYESRRKPAVAKIQDSAGPSLSWWEHFGTYQRTLDPLTFAFHFFSRSIPVSKIARRDPELVRQVRSAWLDRHEGLHVSDSTIELGAGNRTVKRKLRLENDSAAALRLVDVDGHAVPVSTDRSAGGVALLHAPDDPNELDAAIGQLPEAGAVVITGGSELSRTLLSEHARLQLDLRSVLTGDYTDDEVETAVLSGRADAVAIASPTAGSAR